jgi:hypothetical protein
LAAWSCGVAGALRGADAEGFEPLFNGRNLAGWANVNCAPETFTVRDGMIHCDGVPTGALRTTKQYENFILELEWRHLKAGGNAGVFIWAGPLPAVGQPFLRAIEVQVLDHGYGKSDWFTTHGDVFPIHGSKMKPFAPNKGDRSFPKEMRSKGAPEWNHYRIVATNGVLRLSVNGAEVSGGTDCNWRKGFIALESEGGEVDWRNLRVRELPATELPAGASAPAAEEWRSLYDGRGFRGWTVPADANAWTAADWTLRSAASDKIDATGSDLWSDVKLEGDGELFVDWRWSAKPGIPAAPLVLKSAGGVISMPLLAEAKPDAWNRLLLRRQGTTAELVLNDSPAGSVTVPTGALQVGLRPGAVKTDVANPFIKSGGAR